MQHEENMSIMSDRRKIVIGIDTILYIIMIRQNAEIHVSDGTKYKTRMTFKELEEILGDGFVKIHRGCLVSARAIHDITDKVYLSNGESLEYAVQRKSEIIETFRSKQKSIIGSFDLNGIPTTAEEYRRHYGCFDALPVAFTDIEMIFDDERRAVDWIFRYANEALARIEKLPLERLIGSSFGNLFANMDSKWLRSYERATLYGETLEIIDYSPEIDTYLKVICFPTFKGHCGCILSDISEMKIARNSSGSEQALMLYIGRLTDKSD